MAENSNIEWTHHTFNPWRGCTKVSQGCKHCYAETMSGRNPAVLGVWGPKGSRPVAAESYWKQPIKWNKDAEAAGERRRVFCASLADVFEGPETMPDEAWADVVIARARLFDLIEATPWLDWLLLTKRPENILKFVPVRWHDTDAYQYGAFPDNIWIGTSVEDQATADERIPHLLRIPARIRFLSMEPLLGPVDLTWLMRHKDETCYRCGWTLSGEAGRCFCGEVYDPLIHWVIVGGESGPNARPMHPQWARSLRDQCIDAGVPFFFKQWGEWAPTLKYAAGLQAIAFGNEVQMGEYVMERVGKKAAGRLLDGREWNEMPEVQP